MHQQIYNEITEDKFMQTLDLMNALSNSSTSNINMTYKYHFDDELNRVNIKDEVTKEYQSNKYNLKLSYYKLKRRVFK